MHRLFSATAVIISAALISLSAEAAGPGGGPHVRVFNGSGGAANHEGHKDWINLLSVHSIRWAPGIESRNVKVRGVIPNPASGLPTGKRQHKPFTVVKPVDKASPLLARAAKTGRPLPEVVLTARNTDTQTAGRVPYYRYELKNVRVVNYQTGGSADEVPTETMSLNYEEIK
ncbi:MAG: Hcp family type VI secretion system effector [Alphaproteobacteria bacterium]